MLLRVRSNVGVWRVQVSDMEATVTDVYDQIKQTRPHVVYESKLSLDAMCREPINEIATLKRQGLAHGDMIYCRVDPSTTIDVTAPPPTSLADADTSTITTTNTNDETTTKSVATTTTTNMRRVIDKDGAIKLVPSTEAGPTNNKGFRKGMLPLRDMKMHWTHFVAMDSQFEFKIKRQETAICKQVSLDVPSISDFQTYAQRFAFQRKRFGFLYGKFVPVNHPENTPTTSSSSANDDEINKDVSMKCLVEAIYEPPQEADNEAAEGFVALDDTEEDKVQQIAEMLGLQRVGWIFGHESREKGYTLSSAEIIMAAEFQLEAADGVKETPFVTVTVSPGAGGTVSVEAFQMSQQCMAMVAEEALEVGIDPKVCVVNETFTAIQEGKASPTVENSFFLLVVPIVQHTSELFVAEFPRANRDLDDRTPTKEELKRQLQKSGKEGWDFVDRLADFNLLLFLAQFLSVETDFPKICRSIIDRDVPLDDGYKILIKTLAGMEGSY